jgi:3-oxoacyl-[acyl-carrier-protein] synthase II
MIEARSNASSILLKLSTLSYHLGAKINASDFSLLDSYPAPRRVVVTGVGGVTPVGNDIPTTWEAILAGRSGIGALTRFDASRYDIAIAGEVKAFKPEELLPIREIRHMDRYAQFGVVAAMEAVRDAGLESQMPFGPSCGVVFGAGSGGYGLLAQQLEVLHQQGPRRVSPFFLTNVLPDAVSGNIAILTGANGPNMAVIAACATGAGAVGEAAEIIRRGDADIMIAGAAEAPLNPVLYPALNALRAIASPGEDSSTACRPFDRRRDGFVVAEGAGAVVLESLEHAQRRGVEIYAELAGYGSSNDAFDMVASKEDGLGPVLAMEMALRKSRIDPARIGYVNAHGTATQLNDRVETHALKRVFGKQAYRFAVSSTKSMTGHMMGAAGAIEAVFTVLALRDQVLPPTMHYEEPDPDCDLDYVPNASRLTSNLEAALSTSIGLGGHNAALIFRRLE